MAAKRQRADVRNQERPAALANVVFALGSVTLTVGLYALASLAVWDAWRALIAL